MDEILRQCIGGAVPTGLLLGAFYLWLKYGKTSRPGVGFDLVADRNQNWEAHGRLETRLGKVENRVTAIEVDIRNHGASIEEIKATLRQIDSKIDRILMSGGGAS